MPTDRLDSWKEIAGYLRRDTKTVRRWEKNLGLPVHRLQREKLDAVYALKTEIDAWRESRTIRPNPPVSVAPAPPDLQLKEGFPPEPPADEDPETPLKVGRRYQPAALRTGVGVGLLAVVGAAAWITHRPEIGVKPPPFRRIIGAGDSQVRTAAISPNGHKVAYALEGPIIYVRDLGSNYNQPILLPQGQQADLLAWYSDDSAILANCNSVTGGKPSIWKVSIGQTPPLLMVDDARNGVPSADGAEIAYTDASSSEIWVVKDGQPRRVVPASGSDTLRALVWSPDGRRVSYQRLEPQPSYESVDVSSGAVTAKTIDICMEYACGLRDGRILISSHQSDAQTGAWEVKTDLRTGAFLGEAVKILDQPTDGGLSATADGRLVLGVSAENRAEVRIASMEEPGPRLANIRNLTRNQESGNSYPQAWSGDSTEVIFTSSRFDGLDLFRQRLDGSTPVTIVGNEARKFLPQLTPDGRLLLYSSRSSGGPLSSLWRVPIKGGAPEEVPIGGPLDEFRCGTRPGSRCVLRTAETGKFVFWELDALRGKGRELARTALTSNILGDWTLSPDGSQVAIPIHAAADARIRLVTVDSGAERELVLPGLASLRGLHWAADGKGWFVAIQKSNDTSLYYADLMGNSHLLREVLGVSWAVPSPDGRSVAFVDYSKLHSAWVFDRN